MIKLYIGGKMNLLYINSQEYKDRIEELYLESFPEDERFPFWILEECSKENNSDLLAIVDNGVFVGMSYIVNCNDAYYLMYLAVEPNLRNKNYGSHILMDLEEKYKTLFLSIDDPINELNIRRKNFYLRNGFYDTNKYYEDTGVNYEVLCTNPEYEITNENMQMRYTNTTSNSELLSIIANTFNADYVNLKNKSVSQDIKQHI